MGVIRIVNSARLAACAAGLIAFVSAVAPSAAAGAPSPASVPQQHQQAQRLLSETQARLNADQAQVADLDRAIAGSVAASEAQRLRLRLVARDLYKQPASPLVVLARSGTLLEAMRGLGDFNELGIAARSDRRQLAALEQQVVGLREERKRLLADEDSLHRSLQLQLIQVSSLEVWNRTLIWQLANHDFKAPDNPAHSTPNRFVAPLAGGVLTQAFGPTGAWMEPAYGPYPHFHSGIDLAAPYGTAVVAADDGVVLFAGHDGYGYGNYVVLGHPGGLATLYGHLATTSVRTGDLVKQGDRVGLEGSTGNSTGAHLHFELRVDGTPVDPRSLLQAG